MNKIKEETRDQRYYRAIFLSDIHLGTKDAQTERLLDFLKQHDSEHLYLVGDIVDGWALRKRWCWRQSHSDVIQKVLRKARKGTKVTYVLGNHDDFVCGFLPLSLGDNLEIVREAHYIDKQQRRLHIIHGDIYDPITMNQRWIALMGDKAYSFLLRLNRPLNYIRRLIGYHRHWSLSKYAKESVKRSLMFISNYEQVLSSEAKYNGYDGVICGHIHKAETREIDDILYLNCGDWVESCTALVETSDGEWKIVDYSHRSG